MSSDTFNYFSYDPQWKKQQAKLLGEVEEKSRAPKTENKPKIQIKSVSGTHKNQGLTHSQKNLLKTVINEQIYLDPSRDHQIAITILGDDQFSVTFDEKARFFISKQGAGKNERIVAIQERIKNKTFMRSIRDFFQAIANLFYKPSFASPELKKRNHKEAVQQDYRGLRKSLEEGRSWMQNKKKIRLTSGQTKERKTLVKEVNSAITHAKKIENALENKNQADAFAHLADEFSAEVFLRMSESGDSIVIPVGYLNKDGVLQPVMLRFHQDKDAIALDIYADAAEGQGKIAPMHRRVFSDKVTQSDIKNVLELAFKPMISQKSHKGALAEAAEASNTFGQIFASEWEKTTAQLLPEKSKKSKEEPSEEKKAPAPTAKTIASLTFEGLIRGLDSKVEEKWTDTTDPDQKLHNQPTTPAARISKWFDTLTKESGQTLSRNEKLNLMHFITENWISDQLLQLERKPPLFKQPPLEKQLAVYEKVLDQIQHFKGKIAVSINDGHPLETEGIPESLREKEALCLEKAQSIRSKLHAKKLTGTTKLLQQAHSESLGITLGTTSLPPISPAALIGSRKSVSDVNRVELLKAWEVQQKGLVTLLSPESAKLQRARQIVIGLGYAKVNALENLERSISDLQPLIKNAQDYSNLSIKEKITLLETISSSEIIKDKDALSGEVQKAKDAQTAAEQNAILDNNPSILKALQSFLETGTEVLGKKKDAIDFLQSFHVGDLIENDKLNTEKLDRLLEVILLETQSAAHIGINEEGIISPEELVSIVRQMILFPQILPIFSSEKGHHDIISLMKRITDPLTDTPSNFKQDYQALHAFINIRHILPKASMEEAFTSSWSSQSSRFKISFEKMIDQFFSSQLEAVNQSIQGIESILQEESHSNIPEARISFLKNSLLENQLKKRALTEGRTKEGCEILLKELTRQLDGISLKDDPAGHKIIAQTIEWINHEIVSGLEAVEDKVQFVEGIQTEDNMSPFMSVFEMTGAPFEALTAENLHTETINHQQTIIDTLTELTDALEYLGRSAAQETNVDRKRALFDEIQVKSLQLLKMLPPPGTDGSQGTPSIWRALTYPQRQQMLKNIHALEHQVWEAQMRLSKTELPGKERFLMIKAQAIRQEIIRAEVSDQADRLEVMLSKAYNRDPGLKVNLLFPPQAFITLDNPRRVLLSVEHLYSDKITELAAFVDTEYANSASLDAILSIDNPGAEDKKAIIDALSQAFRVNSPQESAQSARGTVKWDSDKQEVTIDWPQQDIELDFIRQQLTDAGLLLGANDSLNPLLLELDAFTLDTDLINQLLSQDLTACLSENAELEQDLHAVFHFLVRDQNRGKSDTLTPPAKVARNNKKPRMSVLNDMKNMAKGFTMIGHKPEPIPRIFKGGIPHHDSKMINDTLRSLEEKQRISTISYDNMKAELLKAFKVLNIDSFESESGAISWDADKDTLVVKWDKMVASDWKKLHAEYHKAHQEELKFADRMNTVIDNLVQGELYYRTVTDPDFTLYEPNTGSGAPLGVTYFQQNPELLLAQDTRLEIANNPVKVDEFSLVNDEDRTLASVRLNGKPEAAYDEEDVETYTEEQKQLLIRQKKPFLPTVQNDTAHQGVNLTDMRTLRSFDVWTQYVSERIQDESLSLPPQILQQLFQMRQASGEGRDGYTCTAYSSDTAINALEFIANPQNQSYLEHDFVQKYLEESLFGPMVIQQALVEHPELVLNQLPLIVDLLKHGQKSENHELVGFLSGVIGQLQAHIQFTRNELSAHGYLSGLLTTLPVFLDKKGGVFYKHFQNGFMGIRGTTQTQVDWMKSESIDPFALLQPLGNKLKILDKCHETISEINQLSTNEGSSYRDLMLTGKKGERPIDKITNPEALKQAYTHLLQLYRIEQNTSKPSELTPDDLKEILIGYRLLSDSEIEGGLPSLQNDLVIWVKTEVLPQIQSMESQKRDIILTSLINKDIGEENWDFVEESSHTYRINLLDQTITIDLTSMKITGLDLKETSQKPTYLPDSILKRSDVAQALQAPSVLAQKSKVSGGIKYTFSHEGQQFELFEKGPQVTITRRVPSGPFQGTYTFQPMLIPNPKTHPESLLQKNGGWKKEGYEETLYLFSEGMSVPNEDTVYTAQIQNGSVQNLRALTGGFVSQTASFDSPSPLLFADTKNVLTIIDPRTKRPVEMRLEQVGLSLKKKEGQWECFRKGVSLGIMKAPTPQEEEQLIETFGVHWDQFVVPLEREVKTHSRVKGELKESIIKETLFLILPYSQQVDRSGRMQVNFDSMDRIPHPEILTTGAEGSIRASLSSSLYLAHHFLLQAEHTRNPTIARQLVMKADKHLQAINGERPPENPEDIEKIKHALEIISAQPSITLERAPSPTALILSLRLGIQIRELRTAAQKQGIHSLELPPKDEMAELERITKQYEAYYVMEKSGNYEQLKTDSTQQLHKQIFNLTPTEKASLSQIANRMLQTLTKNIADKTVGTYFGGTGRIETPLSMDRPKEFNPQFLLALIRMAKPYNPTLSIKEHSTPMPVGELLQNFWSYFLSIKNDNIPPEQISFLFEESLLPPTQSAEEETQLKALDLQARQFLLSMADMQKELGKGIDPMKLAQKGVEQAQKEMNEQAGPNSLIGAFIGQFKGKADLGRRFAIIQNGVEQLQVQPKEGKDPPIPDIRQLVSDIQEIETHVVLFADMMEDTKNDAEQLIKRIESEYAQLSKERSVALSNYQKMQRESEETLAELEHQGKMQVEKLQKQIKEVNEPFQKRIDALENGSQQLAKDIDTADTNISEMQSQMKEALNRLEGKFEGEELKRQQAIIEESFQPKIRTLKTEHQRLTKDRDEKVLDLEQKKSEWENEIANLEETQRRQNTELEEQKVGVEESFHKKLRVLEEAAESADKKLTAFLEKEFKDPVSNDLMSRKDVIDGSYADAIQLEKLQEITGKMKIMRSNLRDQIIEISNLQTKLDQWQLMEGFCLRIQENPFQNTSWFTLPEKGRAHDLITSAIQNPANVANLTGRDLIAAGASLIHELGVAKSAKLVKALSHFQESVSRLEEVGNELKKLESDKSPKAQADREALQKEEREIQTELLSNPLGKVTAFAAPLGSFVLMAQNIENQPPITFTPEGATESTKALQTFDVEQIRAHPVSPHCFTEDQLKNIAEQLETLDPKEQRSFGEQLLKVLNIHEKILAAQTGLNENVDKINDVYESRVRSVQKPAAQHQPPSFESIANKSRFDAVFSPFFRGNAAFPSSLDALEEIISQKQIQDRPALDFLKNRSSLIVEHLVVGSQKEQEKNITDSSAEISQHFPEPELKTIWDCLEVIALANTTDFKQDPPLQAIADFLDDVGKCETSGELLELIQTTYEAVAPHVSEQRHSALVDSLRRETLPDDDSLYRQDLEKGFTNLEKNNPLPFSRVIASDQIEKLEETLQNEVRSLKESVVIERAEIIKQLKQTPLRSLPSSLQKIRLRKGSDAELMQEAEKEYRKGSFSQFPASGTSLTLDEQIGKHLIDRTQLKVMTSARFNATDSIQELYALREEKKAIEQQIAEIDQWLPPGTKSSLEHIQAIQKAKEDGVIGGSDSGAYKIGDVRDHGGDSYTLVLDVKNFSRGEDHTVLIDKNIVDNLEQQRSNRIAELNARLSAIDSKWARESGKIRDFTDRCQSTAHLETLPSSLAPYARHVNFLQERLGLVLRDDQISTLVEIIENPSLLKQLRMGLGKTSILVPFALMILNARGFNTIGMVPKALFTSNLKEMDETTRVVFELAGNEFLFSRQDAPYPFSTLVLHQISQKCADFFKAIQNNEYILTTIESKASLDDKINEIERSQVFIQSRIDAIIEENDQTKDMQINALYPKLVEHQMVLDMLYRVKGVFEAENTRLIIDEADSVARANYSVNSEIGSKIPPNTALQEAISSVWDIICRNHSLQPLLSQVSDNNQFTLTEKEMNETIVSIAKAWIAENKHKLPEGWRENEAMLIKMEAWFAGGESPFTPSDVTKLGVFADELKIMRKALNSSLRSSLALKIGLSAEFDPTHGAVGVPASQGITSKTTKYSDPLMQLCLTHMIALYKPQSEAFLKSAAVGVVEEMKKELKSNLQELQLLGDTNPLKSEKLQTENKLLQNGIDKLIDLIKAQKTEAPPLFQNELEGKDPLSVFLRQKFARQAAKMGLIYVSDNQISRPAQHALRGCHVIGLTGTATRNTEHVITSTGHEDGMKGVSESGRESTAEVVYRFVKSLPDGLQTPVRTYSLEADTAFNQFKEIAKEDSGFRFLINQAGACDQLRLREIAWGLHEAEGRPIVFLDMDEEGRSVKSVLIKGVSKPLDRITPEEGREIEARGFFYYHTPHVRGTHFDIPSGSKGALMLSPTVNANDRDQAIYRARGLGEGHAVVPFISEKQEAALKGALQKETVTVADILKVQHEQTRQDEAKEDLSAYQLHLKGLVVLAADQAKEKIQTVTLARSLGKWTTAGQREASMADIEAKVKIFELLEQIFIQDSSNEAYIHQLDKEIYQGGEIDTGEYLTTIVIPGEERRIARLLAKVNDLRSDDSPELSNALDIIERELKGAEKKLQMESAKISDKWESLLSKQLPDTTSAAPATQETAETEAEAEAQEQQETTSETAADLQKRNRNQSTQAILSGVDADLLDSIQSKEAFSRLNAQLVGGVTVEKPHLPSGHSLKPIWKDGIFLSRRLAFMLNMATGGALPDMKVVVIPTEKRTIMILTDAADANNLMGHYGHLVRNELIESKLVEFLTGGFTVKPVANAEGELQLHYTETSMGSVLFKEHLQSDPILRGEMYLALMHIGHTQIDNEGWNDIKEYWKSLEEPDKLALKTSLEEALGKTNPKFLERAALQLWNIVESKAIALGGTKPAEESSFDNLSDALTAMQNDLKEMIWDRERDNYKESIDKNLVSLFKQQAQRWMRGKEISPEVEDQLLDWIDSSEEWMRSSGITIK
jgi:hypothetical protein